MLICPGIHCMVICLLSHLRLNLRGSTPVDFPSRAAHRDWKSVNTATEDFCGTPICKQCTASSRALFSSSNEQVKTHTSPSYGFHNLKRSWVSPGDHNIALLHFKGDNRCSDFRNWLRRQSRRLSAGFPLH